MDGFLLRRKAPRQICYLNFSIVLVFAGVMCFTAASYAQTGSPTSTETHVPLVFSGGHETDPRDRGRPVILVASALGVPPEVFREAFTHVHPAPAGLSPTPEEAQQNKAALMSALAPYGVTNDRLDTVSNYYRYVRSQGQLWPIAPAQGYAIVQHGVVKRFVITHGGSGYSSPPSVSVPGYSDAKAVARLTFSSDFEKNGSVAGVGLVGR